ncbi:MAG: protein kinase, partial [Acidobacteria bacterium]|nr:protein kinase [Acidobacteriota bacterium]
MPNLTEWRQIEDLYYDALELPDAERAAFLAHACAGDATLQREVVSLLAARAEAHGFLSQSVAGSAPLDASARLGTHVGQYQLLSLLGTGGMGEVFLAEDTRLHRQVALKLLPTEFSQNPQRIHRFEQEARATTALNHPNIVTLHDTGQHEGVYYIVTEFVDGQTLREHLNERGALPVNEALDLAQQIARALAAAHAADIVHRDIKPENVMLRRDGFVKVLDFGLAKLTDALPEAKDETHDEENPHSALRTPHSQTAAGALLGTIRYMSPEQARGETVDARTDVFSLGVVLYEMLTGKHPFARATATQTMAAILEAEPAALPASMPAPLQRLIAEALDKDSTQRLQTATEMATALQQLTEETQFSTRLAETRSWRFWMRQWWIWASVALVVGGMVLVWRFSRDEFEPTIPSQLKFRLVESWKTEPNQAATVLSSSPDGNLLVFAKVQNGQPDIYLKQVDGDAPRNLTNDSWNDFGPVWSPDGTGIAYLSIRDGRYEIWLVGYSTGASRQLGILPNRPTWLTSW